MNSNVNTGSEMEEPNSEKSNAARTVEAVATMDSQKLLLFIALGFVLVSIAISLHQIAKHFYHYNEPKFQIYIVRIMMMIPVIYIYIYKYIYIYNLYIYIYVYFLGIWDCVLGEHNLSA